MEKRIAITRQGRLRGISGRNPDITVFKGVPYARPPIGDLRWRVPMPAIPWSGIRDAGRFEAMPVQTQGYFLPVEPFDDLYSGEDCLYLNIWTPAKAADQDLAVLVWFHGGAFQGGMAHDPMFDGEYLAAKGIILVTVGYRMNIFGFMCHSDMAMESPHRTAGNFGILDQVEALHWIHENISGFGGSPDKVTIAGQSAGGLSVSCILSTSLADGLYRGAIIESGDPLGLDSMFRVSYQERLADGNKIADHFGVKTLDELRRIPADELVRSDYDVSSAVTGRFCAPVVDGAVIPVSPADALLHGGPRPDVPMIFGSNSEDGLSLEAENSGIYRETIQKIYGADSGRILEKFPAGNEDELKRSVTALSAIQWQQRLRVLMKAREQRGVPSWQYYMTQGVLVKGVQMGATHSAELGYVFGSLSYSKKVLEFLVDLLHLKPDEEIDESAVVRREQKLAEQISDYWVWFVKKLNPNNEGLPEWNCSTGAGSRLILGEDTHMISDGDEEINHMVYKNSCRLFFRN